MRIRVRVTTRSLYPTSSAQAVEAAAKASQRQQLQFQKLLRGSALGGGDGGGGGGGGGGELECGLAPLPLSEAMPASDGQLDC